MEVDSYMIGTEEFKKLKAEAMFGDEKI